MREYRANGLHYVWDGPGEILALPASETFHDRADRSATFRAALDAVTLPGPWAQFGVFRGHTANAFILPRLPEGELLYLFDSWQGLPEDWEKGSSVEPRGKYACRPPDLGPRTVNVPGLYCDTVPLHSEGDPWAFVDIDCDLYEGTRDVLLGMNGRIAEGTVIRFDEVFSYPNWREHEWRALCEWREQCDRAVEWISRGVIYWAACVVTR